MSSLGQNYHKCNRQNHCELVFGILPSRGGQGRARSNNCSMVNEIRNTSSLTSNAANTTQYNSSNMVPKQVLDTVDMANSVDNLSECYKRYLELDTLTMSNSMSPTQVFSNIEIDSILV